MNLTNENIPVTIIRFKEQNVTCVKARQPKTTRDTPVVEQVEFITQCSEGECTQVWCLSKGCYKRLTGYGGGLKKPEADLEQVLSGSRGI